MNILKRLFILSVLLVSATMLNAQKMPYYSGSFEDAKAEAKKQHKLIYVMVEVNEGSNAYYPVPLDDELLKRYQSAFICLNRTAVPSNGADSISQKYNVTTFPGHLFLDSEGGLILKTTGYDSRKDRYMKDIDRALQLSKTKTLTKYTQEYQKGNRNTEFMQRYLLKYDELDLPVNQDVLDAYARLLPVSAADDYETIAFIMKLGPVLSSTAYKITRINLKLTDSLYKTLPYPERVKMNNKIINASMAAAKKTKNEALAMQTASFTQSTWNNDWQKGYAANMSRLMEYYYAVKDTTKYLRNASSYYQQYYLAQRDSIHVPQSNGFPPTGQHTTTRKTTAITDSAKFGATVKDPVPDLSSMPSMSAKAIRADSARIVTKSITRVVMLESGTTTPLVSSGRKAMEYAMNLNNGAWAFYTMRTTNASYLSQAVIWVWRAIELFPDNSAFYDTLAHLYYLQKKYGEATAMQQNAIDVEKQAAKIRAEMMAKSNFKPSKPLPDYSQKQIETYTTALEKMKQRKL